MRKDEQIIINLEPLIAEAFKTLAQKEGKSISSYGRILILKHLIERAVLPTEFR